MESKLNLDLPSSGQEPAYMESTSHWYFGDAFLSRRVKTELSLLPRDFQAAHLEQNCLPLAERKTYMSRSVAYRNRARANQPLQATTTPSFAFMIVFSNSLNPTPKCAALAGCVFLSNQGARTQAEW